MTSSPSVPTPLRVRIHALLEGRGRSGRAVVLGLSALILTSVTVTVLESTEPDRETMPTPYLALEWLAGIVFSIEYALRLWTAPLDPRYAGSFGRLRFARTPLALIDLLAIVPFWWKVLLGTGADLQVVRLLRMLRLLRIAKLGRHSRALQALGDAFWSRRYELGTALMVLLTLLLIASTLMYQVEHDAHPGTFSSIPAAMWWGIATLTTVGYGDVVPATPLGKVLGAVIAVLGIGVFALPAAIMTGALQDAMARGRAARERTLGNCPHCGEPLDKV